MAEKSNISIHDWVDCGIDGIPEYAIVRKTTGTRVRLSNGKQYKLSELKGIPLTIDNLLLNGYEICGNKVYNPTKSRFPVFALNNDKLITDQTIHNVQHTMRYNGLVCASYLWKVEADDNDYQQTLIHEQMLLNSGLLFDIDKKGRNIFFPEHDNNWLIIHNEDSAVYTLMYDNDYLSCWHVEKLQYYFDILGINIALSKN